MHAKMAEVSNIRTETIQTTIGALDGDFAGRSDDKQYDPTKLIHIHRRNRAYVWKTPMQQNFVDSALKNYYIPPIICSSRIVNGREVREVMEGGNRVTTARRVLRGQVTKPNGEKLTEAEMAVLRAYPITLVVMRGLTSKDQRLMFGRLNKSVKVTDGHLYAMSEEDSPLVKEALALLNDPDYPLRARITAEFFDTVDNDNAGRRNLENAIALVAGILYGVKNITTSFDRQEAIVESQEPIDREVIIDTLTNILDIFQAADEREALADRRKRKGQWPIGKYLGAILYDLATSSASVNDIQLKWVNYLVRVRGGHENAEEAIVIPGAQNLTADKLRKKSYKVDVFMRENRLATEAELKEIKHAVTDSPEESEEEEGESTD